MPLPRPGTSGITLRGLLADDTDAFKGQFAVPSGLVAGGLLLPSPLIQETCDQVILDALRAMKKVDPDLFRGRWAVSDEMAVRFLMANAKPIVGTTQAAGAAGGGEQAAGHVNDGGTSTTGEQGEKNAQPEEEPPAVSEGGENKEKSPASDGGSKEGVVDDQAQQQEKSAEGFGSQTVLLTQEKSEDKDKNHKPGGQVSVGEDGAPPPPAASSPAEAPAAPVGTTMPSKPRRVTIELNVKPVLLALNERVKFFRDNKPHLILTEEHLGSFHRFWDSGMLRGLGTAADGKTFI